MKSFKAPKTVIIFLFLLLNCPLFSENTISPYSGIRSGIINEYMRYDTGDGIKTTSQLDWSFTNPIIGISMDFSPLENIFLSVNTDFSIPTKIGSMEDYDWYNIYTENGTFRTHYSWNKNRTLDFITGELKGGYNLQVTNNFSIIPSLEYGFEHFSFTAFDGYKQYATKIGKEEGYDVYEEWDPSIPKEWSKGDKVSFEGIFSLLGPEVTFLFTAFDKLHFTISEALLFSVYSKQVDNHMLRNFKLGYDSTGLTNSKTNVKIKYDINEHNSIGIFSSFNFIFPKYSNCYKMNTDSEKETYQKWMRISNIGDFRQLMYTVSLSYCYRY